MMFQNMQEAMQGERDKVHEHIERVTAAAESAPAITTASATTAGGHVVSLGPEAQALMPYINGLEGSLGEQQRLHETLSRRLDLLAQSIEADSGELHRQIMAMGEATSGLFYSFSHLEGSFEGTMAVIARWGKQLDQLCRTRHRSHRAKELFQIFLELNSGKTSSRLQTLLESSSLENRRNGAKIMRLLRGIAKAGIPDAEKATKMIEEMTKRYEEGLLGEFHQAFEENDMPRMRDAAGLLTKYNGGQSCIQSFVSQHAFFTNPVQADQIISQFHPSKSPAIIDFSKPPEPDIALVALYERILQTTEADWNYLEAVFNNSVVVMNYLLQRIFREPVQVHIDQILQQAKHHSNAAYLRTLLASYLATKQLIDRMEAIHERHIKEASAKKRQVARDPEEQSTIGMLALETLNEELFSQHINPSFYVDLERKTFADFMTMAISPLQLYISTRKASSRSVMSTVFGRTSAASQSQTINPASAGGTSSSASTPTLGTSISADLLARAKRFTFAGGLPLLQKEDGENGVPSERIVKNAIVLHAEMATRLYTLLPADQRGDALEASFRSLLQMIFEKYAEASLDCAMEASESSSKGFDPRSFIVIQAACRILSLLLIYSRSSFLPIIVSSSSMSYRNMVHIKTEAAARLTEKIDKLLQKECEDSLHWIQNGLLSKQKKTDYRPRPDDLEALVGPSAACEATCDFVSKLAKVILTHLDTTNAAAFLNQIGSGLHVMLLEHIKNFTISDTGAMVLQNDLRRYKSTIEQFGPASEMLKDRYEMLWELGHLFLVRPENLRTILQEGYLGRLDSKLIYPFISQRADFNSSHIQQLFPDMEHSFTKLFS